MRQEGFLRSDRESERKMSDFTPAPTPARGMDTGRNVGKNRGNARKWNPTGIASTRRSRVPLPPTPFASSKRSPRKSGSLAYYRGAVSRAVLRARSKIIGERGMSRYRDWRAGGPRGFRFYSRTPVRVNGQRKTPPRTTPQDDTNEVELAVNDNPSVPSSPDSVVVLHIGPVKSNDYEDISEADSADETEEMDMEIIESSQPPSPIPWDHCETEVDLEEEHKQALLLQEAIQVKQRQCDEKLTESEDARKIGIAECPLPLTIGPAPPALKSSNKPTPLGATVAAPGNFRSGSVAAILSSAVIPLVEKFIEDKSCCPTAKLSPGQAPKIRVEFILPQNQLDQQNPPAVGHDPSLIELVEFGGAKAMEGHFQVVHVAAATKENKADPRNPGELQDKMTLIFGEVVMLDIKSVVRNELKYYQLELKRNQHVQISPSGIYQFELVEPRRFICRQGEYGKSMRSEVLRCQVQGSSQPTHKNISIQQPGPIIVSAMGGILIATIGISPRPGGMPNNSLKDVAPYQQERCPSRYPAPAIDRSVTSMSGGGQGQMRLPVGQAPKSRQIPCRYYITPSRNNFGVVPTPEPANPRPLQRFPGPPQPNLNLSVRELLQIPVPVVSTPPTRPYAIGNTAPSMHPHPTSWAPGQYELNPRSSYYPPQTLPSNVTGTLTAPTGFSGGPRYNGSNGVTPGSAPYNYYGTTAGITGVSNAPKCNGDSACWCQMK